MPIDAIRNAAGAAYGEKPSGSGPRGALSLRDKQSPPAGSGGVDPLAELARLIEQDEAFGAVVRSGRSGQPGERSVRRDERPPSRLAREDDAFAHDRDFDAGAPLVPSFLCDGPIGDPHDAHARGEADGPDYANGLPAQRSRLPLFAALVGFALAGSAGAMAYWAWSDARVRGDETRVIGASLSPDKMLPAAPGESRSEERRFDQSDERSVDTIKRPATAEEKPADATADAPAAVPPTGVLYGPAPAKVAALTSGAAPPGSPADPAQNQPVDVKEPPPAETAPSAADPGAPEGPRYVVQLSSQRSEAAAQITSRLLQTKYADVFGGRQPFIRRSDLGDRGVYYRVLTGPFAIGEAKQLCGDLKKSGADCVVQKN
jgi:cell division septation protein DedD